MVQNVYVHIHSVKIARSPLPPRLMRTGGRAAADEGAVETAISLMSGASDVVMAEPDGTTDPPLAHSAGYIVADPPVSDIGPEPSTANCPMHLEMASELPHSNELPHLRTRPAYAHRSRSTGSNHTATIWPVKVCACGSIGLSHLTLLAALRHPATLASPLR